jgi:hypothetical protein
VPEDCGGLGMDDVAWSLMTQELGYYAIPDSLADTAYVSAGLIKALPAGSHGREELLGRIADGSVRIAIGHPVNPLVADAATADLLLLPHGDEVHLVPRALVDVTANPSIDLSRRLASLAWEPSSATRIAAARPGATCGPRPSTGHPVGGRPAARPGPAHARPVGGLRRPAQAVRQAHRQLPGGQAPPGRRGHPHRVRQAGALPRRPRPGPRRPGCGHPRLHAKLACGEAAWLAARHGIQVHGAMGYTWEVDLQMFMKRTWALDASWGDRGFHKSRVAEAILADGAAIGPGHTFEVHA